MAEGFFFHVNLCLSAAKHDSRFTIYVSLRFCSLGADKADKRATGEFGGHEHRLLTGIPHAARNRRHPLFLHPAGGRAHAPRAEQNLERARTSALEWVSRTTSASVGSSLRSATSASIASRTRRLVFGRGRPSIKRLEASSSSSTRFTGRSGSRQKSRTLQHQRPTRRLAVLDQTSSCRRE